MENSPRAVLALTPIFWPSGAIPPGRSSKVGFITPNTEFQLGMMPTEILPSATTGSSNPAFPTVIEVAPASQQQQKTPTAMQSFSNVDFMSVFLCRC
jgi:hypothetical protein